MNRLIIENIGPISHVELPINRLNVISHIIQFVVNIVILVLLVGHIEGYGHKEKEEEAVEEIEIP